jgi:hypothetical protein
MPMYSIIQTYFDPNWLVVTTSDKAVKLLTYGDWPIVFEGTLSNNVGVFKI